MTNSEVKFAFESNDMISYTIALWNASRDGDLDTVRKLVTLKHDIDEQSHVH